MMRPVWLVARALILHSVRQKEVQLLAIVGVALTICGVLARLLIGADDAPAETFVLHLGLSFVFASVQFFTVLTAARQLPEELENQTVMPLLAKPLGRGQFLCGKWLGAFMLGAVALLVIASLWVVVSPGSEDYFIGTLVQAIAMQIGAMSMVSALGVFLSVMTPLALTLGLSALILFKPDLIQGALRVFAHTRLEKAAGVLNSLYPRFSYLDLSGAYCGGVPPQDLSDMFVRLLYAVLWTVLPLVAALLIFARKRL